MGERARGQSRHCRVKQYGGKRFTASQHARAFVVIRGQHEDFGVVVIESRSSITVAGDGEVASDVDAVALESRYQRTVRYPLARLEQPGPPVKFGVIRRVVEAKRFGE